MIELHVNGELKTSPLGASLADLLTQMGLNPQLVAVEYNGEILQRGYWGETILQGGDRLEVVTIVGGG
jgi:sulfur carrier protein